MGLGGRYLLRADGIEAAPNCLIMVIDKDGSATISMGAANYTHDIQASNDLLAASVDKPMVLAFASSFNPSETSGGRGIAGETDGLMKSPACS